MYINPFYRSVIGNFSPYKAANNQYVKIGANCSLPDSTLSFDDIQNAQQQLHVPNQDIPLGDQTSNIVMNDDYIKLPDGSILNFSTHKLVKSPKCLQNGYWNDPNDKIESPYNFRDNTWNDKQNNNIDRYITLGISAELSRNDIIYQNYINKKANELCANMNDIQKQMLAELESFGFFDSKLENE